MKKLILICVLLLTGCETPCRTAAQLTVPAIRVWIDEGCSNVSCPGEDCEEQIVCVLCEEWGEPVVEYKGAEILLRFRD